MPLTTEQKKQVLGDLIDAFKMQQGEDWSRSFHRNLRPSPLKEIAERQNVSQNAVRKIRSDLMMAGVILSGGIAEEVSGVPL